MADFNDILNFDPFTAAEKLSGKSADEDEETVQLAMGLALAHNATMREELALRGDSYYGMGYSEYLAILEELEFELVWKETFNENEVQEVYWLDGLLLVCDSHRSKLNTASLYFNASFHNSSDAFRLSLSGHIHGPSWKNDKQVVWVGSMDARIALKHHLAELTSKADILSPWLERDHMWLLNYAEEREDPAMFEIINEAKIAGFPEAIRTAISPENSQ